jgi:hypothetical protein
MDLAGRRRLYKARAEGFGMHHLHSIIHFFSGFRVVNKSVRVTCFAHAVPMLLSKLDELTQGSNKLGEAGLAWLSQSRLP